MGNLILIKWVKHAIVAGRDVYCLALYSPLLRGLYVRAVKTLTRLCVRAGLSEPWLLINPISKVHVPKSLARGGPYNHSARHSVSFNSAKSVNAEYMRIPRISF